MVGEVRDFRDRKRRGARGADGAPCFDDPHTNPPRPPYLACLMLGVEGYLLRSTLRAVVAQRLVRTIVRPVQDAKNTQRCRFFRRPASSLCSAFARRDAQGPCGCERCDGTGYRGRLGVFEILELPMRFAN